MTLVPPAAPAPLAHDGGRGKGRRGQGRATPFWGRGTGWTWTAAWGSTWTGGNASYAPRSGAQAPAEPSCPSGAQALADPSYPNFSPHYAPYVR
jgi:hypothetical protein